MVGLLHYSTFLPGDATALIDALAGPAERWLGGTPVSEGRFLLRVQPDGLLADPTETVEVVVGVGPVARSIGHVLRRMSFEVTDLTPEVRCDVELTPGRVRGCHLHVRGEYRPPLATHDGRAVAEVVDSVTRPMVEEMARRMVDCSTLQV